MLIKFISLIVLLKQIACNNDDSTTSSYNSLISSQCKARCLSLYPWKLGNGTMTNERRNRDMLSRRPKSNKKGINRNQRHFSNLSSHESYHNSNNHFNVKWHKVMELCSKNTNCLQCSLPCDIPTNLLPNCKYLCKQHHPLCIESCSLLLKLNQDKHGSCPVPRRVETSGLINTDFLTKKCSNYSNSYAIALNENNINSDEDLNGNSNRLISNNLESISKNEPINECNKDSDCNEIKKCCVLNPECPEHGNICKKPAIKNVNLPSIPFNLTITERKKGKTVILSWECNYNKNKPTIFVVEGRWSLKSPHLSARSLSNVGDNSFMTKWGYLAQTVNNNWIILRSINRGRWYKFRVAAISKSGTYGYSQPTELFILSSPPKPPTQPQNLSLSQIYLSAQSENKVNVDISWLPPKRSDLPISNYKIKWRQLSKEASLSNFNNPNYDQDENYEAESTSIETENEESISSFKSTSELGVELISAQSLNKFTIKNLNKDSIYSIELVAISKYEKQLLQSNSIRLSINTNNIDLSQSSALIDSSNRHASNSNNDIQNTSSNNNNKEYEYEEEDDDLEASESTPDSMVLRQEAQKQVAMAKDNNDPKRLIKNLTVQTPYFQNGLVKAKLSWQIESLNGNADSDESSASSGASINSKTVLDQPMFTITWFPIKCVSFSSAQKETVTLAQKQLPTPITATTINTNFEIYELKYNCDYVVNVRLANLNKPFILPSALESSNSGVSSVSLNKPLAPQIASAQFKVPHCNLIKISGRIRPTCFVDKDDPSLQVESTTKEFTVASSSTASTILASKKFNSNIDQLFDHNVYNLLFSKTSSPLRSTEPTTHTLSTEEARSPLIKFDKQVPLIKSSLNTISLPRVYNIKYKILNHKLDQNPKANHYSVEFSWLIPMHFLNNNNIHGIFHGYQISVVPKAIPGVYQQENTNDNNIYSSSNFGSVGAIVSKDQLSFVVRNLRSSVRYIFQIQSIGKDNQYGPASTLEFIIENTKNHAAASRRTSSSTMAKSLSSNQDYDVLTNIGENDMIADLEPLSSSDDASLLTNKAVKLTFTSPLFMYFSFLVVFFYVNQVVS